MKRSGTADIPFNGHVLQWLAHRMAMLGLAIAEAVITEYGKTEVIRRLSDPSWFQPIEKEMDESRKYGGKTIFGDSMPSRRLKEVRLQFF